MKFLIILQYPKERDPMIDYANLTIEDLADLLTEKTEQYHKILSTGAELSPPDRMKLFIWLKEEIKLIQWEINSRGAKKNPTT